MTRLVAIALSGFESRRISENKNKKTSKVLQNTTHSRYENFLVPTYGIKVLLLPVSIPVDFVPAHSIEPSWRDITHLSFY